MSQSVIVFSGPTLSPDRVREILPGCACPGPAACGDVYIAGKRGASVIVLIDGYFDHRLSVWHKELLWALSEGFRVYGGASMGALRAAELADHGMIGDGAIFEQFRSGVLEDDDEVAVAHASADHQFAPQSQAMVNVRATLRAALAAGVIDSGDEARLVAAGKALYYPDRTFPAILRAASGLTSEGAMRLQDWLAQSGPIDQKEADALALLHRVRMELAKPPLTQPATLPAFVPTSYWELLTAIQDGRLGARGEPSSLEHWRLRAKAAESALALVLARQAGSRPSAAEVQAESERFRSAMSLLTPVATNQWLEQHGLDLKAFSALIARRVLSAHFAEHARELVEDALRDLSAGSANPLRSTAIDGIPAVR